MKVYTIATLVHTFLYFRTQIIQQTRRTLKEEPDIHARLMSVYPQGTFSMFIYIFVMLIALLDNRISS